MQLREARATDVYRLQLIDRTDPAPCWVIEVETWVSRDAWAWFRDPVNTPARLWVGEHDGAIAVVVAAQRIGAGRWYLPAVFVDAPVRGAGLGQAALGQAVHLVRAEDDGATLEWFVHHQNLAMQAVSSRVGAQHVGSQMLVCGADGLADYQRWSL